MSGPAGSMRSLGGLPSTDKPGHVTPVASDPPKRQEIATCADREQAIRWMVSDFYYRFRQLEATRPGWVVARWAKR